MHSFDATGTEVEPKAGGVVLTRSVAEKLGIVPGELVSLRVVPEGVPFVLRLDAYSDSLMGNEVLLTAADLQRGAGLGAVRDGAPRRGGGSGEFVRAREAMDKFAGVARVSATSDLREILDKMMGLSVLLLAVMLLFAVVLTSTFSSTPRRSASWSDDAS